MKNTKLLLLLSLIPLMNGCDNDDIKENTNDTNDKEIIPEENIPTERALELENESFLNTLQNEKVNKLLKDINFEILLDDVMFEEDKLFLEKLNNMQLSDNPTISEIELELSNVGVTTQEKELILKLKTISQYDNSDE